MTDDEDHPFASGDITKMITEGSAGFNLDPAPASYDSGHDHGFDTTTDYNIDQSHGFETTHDYDIDQSHDHSHGHDHSHEHLSGERETYLHGDHTDRFSFSAADIPHSTDALTPE